MADFITGSNNRRVLFLSRAHAFLAPLVMGLLLYAQFQLMIRALGPDGISAVNSWLEKLSNIPFLFLLEWIFIYLPLLFIFSRGVLSYSHSESRVIYGFQTFYHLHRVTGVLLVFFLPFMIYLLRFLPRIHNVLCCVQTLIWCYCPMLEPCQIHQPAQSDQ